MADLPAVLSSQNGSIYSDLIFVAEAPGRLGAGRTGVPFRGDRSGDNFELLLDHVGLKRKDIFITNAVLCNPLKSGNNRRPTTKEIENCSSFLQDLIDLIAPKVISTLGGVGLEVVNRLFGTRYKLADVVARPLSVCEFILVPLYHPSPRVVYTRRTLDEQKRDFRKLMKTLTITKSTSSQAKRITAQSTQLQKYF